MQGDELVRRRFGAPAELLAAVYASLVGYLAEHDLIRSGPFDAAVTPKATLDDLDPERIDWFIREARRARGFPLAESATPVELLTHLNLLDDGRVTNAAVLLFGRQPQRSLPASEVKCAHFHGTEVAKPIPSYQVYKGNAFTLVDQAVDSRPTAAVAVAGDAARATRIGAGEPAHRRIALLGEVHRADGHGHARHDPAVPHGRPAGT